MITDADDILSQTGKGKKKKRIFKKVYFWRVCYIYIYIFFFYVSKIIRYSLYRGFI